MVSDFLVWEQCPRTVIEKKKSTMKDHGKSGPSHPSQLSPSSTQFWPNRAMEVNSRTAAEGWPSQQTD